MDKLLLVGAILGDIVGSTWEFEIEKPEKLKGTNMLFQPESNFTDDTIMLVAIADCLANNSTEFAEYCLKWYKKYPMPMGGYGLGFNAFMRKYAETGVMPASYNSWGNGAAMRIAAIGYYANSDNELEYLVTKACEFTHSHEFAIHYSMAVAEAIRRFKQVSDTDIVLGDPRKYIYTVISAKYHKYEHLNFYKTLGYLHKEYKFDESCQGTVPAAFSAAYYSNCFEQTLRNILYIGGDTDTLGTIAAAISEAEFGVPDELYTRALRYIPDEMISVLEEFTRVVKQRSVELA